MHAVHDRALLSALALLTPVSITDRAGKLTYVNDAFCQLSGYTREQLLGEDHRIVSSGQHWPGQGTPWRGEVCNRAKDGSLYWLDSMIVPQLAEDGGSAGYIGIHTDISASKRPLHAVIEAVPFDRSPLLSLHVLIAYINADVFTELSALAETLGWHAEGLVLGEPLGHALEERLRSQPTVDVLLIDEHADSEALRLALDPSRKAELPAAVLVGEPAAALSSLTESVLAKPLTAAALFRAVNQAVLRHGSSYEQLAEATRIEALEAQLLPGMRLLVVDDSGIHLEVARQLLEHQGALVSTAANGLDALDRVSHFPDAYDAVLIDVQMPVMDGHEAVRHIRSELRLQRLPVIALTAGALIAEGQLTIEGGMNAVINKPIDPITLVRVLRREIELAYGEPIPVLQRVEPSLPTPSVWPIIEGIDSGDVTRRFAHDAQRFTELLRRMLHDFSALAQRGAQGLPSPVERAEYAAQMHKLRGTAGLLGARELRSLAEAVELLLVPEAADSELALRWQALAQAFERLQQSAQPVLDAHARARVEPCDTSAVLDIQTLLSLLQQNNLAARSCFRDLSGALAERLGPASFSRLRTAIERLEYAEAAAVLADYAAVVTV